MKAEIIKLLLYSEIFKHPLSLSDIQSKIKDSENVVAELKELLQAKLIHVEQGYYYVFENDGKIERRKKGNEKAKAMMPKAIKNAHFISRFPFVEGAAISGSLSKGVLFDDGDFDFFIVTTPNRLWIARSFLILYKKLFLLNSKKYFCVNYFIDSDNLEIQEKNIFTAMEIASLLTLEGNVFKEFEQKNQWVNALVYYPESESKERSQISKSFFAKLVMKLCSGRFGDWLDTLFMRLTLKKWNKKFSHFEKEKFDLTMKTRKYISKHHPNNFQQKVLTKYDSILLKYNQLNEDNLHKCKIVL